MVDGSAGLDDLLVTQLTFEGNARVAVSLRWWMLNLMILLCSKK